MSISHGIRAYARNDSRGQALVLSDAYNRDNAQVSGRWMSAENPVRIRS